MKAKVDEIIEEMREQGVIEEFVSPWMSSAILVKKKNRTIKFCVDYRRLNAITKKDSYSLPREDIFYFRKFLVFHFKFKKWVLASSTRREKIAFSEMGYGSLGLCHSVCVPPQRSSEYWN